MDTPARQEETRIATFKLGQQEYQRLEMIARKEERSVSAVLRLAVRRYLADCEAAA